MIYKKIEIAVDGYKETADLYTYFYFFTRTNYLRLYTLIFWIIPLKCISTESVR